MGLSKVSDIKRKKKRKSQSQDDEDSVKRKVVVEKTEIHNPKKVRFSQDDDENSLFDDKASVTDSVSGSDTEDESIIDDEMKGFIVDEVDDDEGISDDARSDDDDYVVTNQLDDDDLSLIAENTGQKSKHRLRKKNKEIMEDSEGETKEKETLDDFLSDDDDEDEWLEDDYGDNEFQMNEMWNGIAECFGDVELVINILKNRKPNFNDYQDEEKNEELPDSTSKLSRLAHIAEPDEIIREYMTHEDEVICNADIPERLSLAYGNRKLPVEIRDIVTESSWVIRMLYKQFSEELSLDNLHKKYIDSFGEIGITDDELSKEISTRVELVLMWLLNHKLEPAYIICQRMHLVSPPLTEDMIWKIYDLDLEWYRLSLVANELRELVNSSGIQNIEIERLLNNFEDFTDLEDVKYYISIRFPTLSNTNHLNNEELEGDDDIDDDNIFGDSPNPDKSPNIDKSPKSLTRPTESISGLNVISTISNSGLHDSWREYFPSSSDFARVLSASIETGYDDDILLINHSKCISEWDLIVKKSAINYVPITNSDIVAQVEGWCEQFQTSSLNSGRKVLDGMITYHAKHLITEPNIRRFLREIYMKNASITTITTPFGENQIDPSSRNWIPSRLYKFPISKLLESPMTSYPTQYNNIWSRLNNLREQLNTFGCLFLEVMNLKEKGLIEVVIHPLIDSENLYWNTQRYENRLKSWKEKYQMSNDSLKQEFEDGKALLDREHHALLDAEKSDSRWREDVIEKLSIVYRTFNRKFHGESILPILTYIQDKIIRRLLRELLIKFKRQVIDKLIRRGQNAVIQHCKAMLHWHFDLDPDKFYQKHNKISIKNQNIACAIGCDSGLYVTFVDSNGFYIQHLIYSFIIGPGIKSNNRLHYTESFNNNLQLEVNDLVDMLIEYGISLLLVGINGIKSYNTYKVLSDKLCNKMSNNDRKFIVELVITRIPQIYASSDKSKREFSTIYPTEVYMGLSLARYFQSPVSEIINLWNNGSENQILELELHPLQDLIPRNKLIKALEMQCVYEVSRNGISLNEINERPHFRMLLQFIPGLGPRKAQSLFQMLSKISNRHLLNQGDNSIIGVCVYENCSSFIRDVIDEEFNDIMEFYREHEITTFEFSRILPKDYNLARRLIDGVDISKLVDEYISTVDRLAHLRARNYINFIIKELENPFKLYNSDYESPNYESIFYASINEDPLIFKNGSFFQCKIESVNEVGVRGRIYPSGITAVVSDSRQLKSMNRNILDEYLPCRLTRIEFRPRIEFETYSFKVEVVITTQMVKRVLYQFYERLCDMKIDKFTSSLCLFDVMVIKKRPFFETQYMKPKVQYKRIIRHPLYRAWPMKKAIAYLRQEQIGIGHCCFLPLPQFDKLNLLLKTCNEPFNCVCFTIHESNQRTPGELGKELIINGESFMSLDQIVAHLCDTLKVNLEEMYSHPRYKSNCDVIKVERELLQECAMKPNSISWALCPPDPKKRYDGGNNKSINHPLRFTLVVVPPGAMIKNIPTIKDSIYISHKKFTLWTHSENTLKSLLNWWKESGYWNRNAELELYNNQKMKKMGHARDKYQYYQPVGQYQMQQNWSNQMYQNTRY